MVGTSIASATTFNLVATIHGSARFAMLQKKLELLKYDDPDCDTLMGDCVKRHQEAIRYL